MPKYIANPVEVDALRITSIQQVPEAVSPPAQRTLHLEDGSTVLATSAMLSRYIPVVGDYWVVQSDGYAYINPASVFERKYRLAKLVVIGDAPTNPRPFISDPVSEAQLRARGFSESQIAAMRIGATR